MVVPVERGSALETYFLALDRLLRAGYSRQWARAVAVTQAFGSVPDDPKGTP